MNKTIRKIIFRCLSIVNIIVPKKEQVMIYGGDYLYDNNEAMFEYLNANADIPIVCIANQHRNIECRENVKFVKDTLWNAIRYSLSSRVLIDSFYHAIRMMPHRRQVSIQLWHGTPLKRIDHHGGENNSRYYTYILYPSEMFRDIYKKTFECTEEKLFLCGNPRNDLLFEPNLGPLIKKGIDRYIIWLPTYRYGFGQEETKNDIPVLKKENITELNRTLKEKNFYLFIKPHPRQTSAFTDTVFEMSNIGLLSDDLLRGHNIPLYSFIGAMDALLTDYSSIYFDYLVLNRPIGFVIDDFEEYKQKRGFFFDDPLSMMPGEKIYDIHQLCSFIRSIGGADAYQTKRTEINNLVNHFQDNQNRKRILDLIRE